MKTLLNKYFVIPFKQYSLTKIFWLFLMLPWLLFDIAGFVSFLFLIKFNATKATTMYIILPIVLSMGIYLLYMNIVCALKSREISSKIKKYFAITLFSIFSFISFFVVLSFSIAGMQTLQNI